MQIRYRKAAAAALICFAIYQAKAQKANRRDVQGSHPWLL